MTFQRRDPIMPARMPFSAAPFGACALALGLLLSSCSDPPQPAPEPTGEDIERAWHLAVGSDPLDRTIAQVYAMALNSHEAPTIVVEEDGQTAVGLAAELAHTGTEEASETEEAGGEDVDDRYEIVIARTMPLAETLDPDGYAELTAPEPENGLGPAAAPEDLVRLVEAQLTEAELFEPTAAVLRSGVHITSVTAETYGVDGGEDTDFDTLAADCGDLVFGVSTELPDVEDLLDETYACVPEDLRRTDEDTLVELLITAEIDAALFTASHPGAADHALVSLEDVRRALPEDQYAPIVSLRVADEVPAVVEEISAALDDEALLTIRRLIYGDDALDPEDAATYWLVEEGLLAEPEDWG
ncbi:glycine betaine ABC transporter substrate-binding protein [Nesterenkonia haasae]|uniref:glycine betaine ABC transporter substrate-binding protein n=1 Tax=Nesterenkonia haasae TaxID=2587813 RepID=UPI00139116B1|nr:glycine betaine ABC transporter substrate-binding protein [Nesterenkonia haasae]